MQQDPARLNKPTPPLDRRIASLLSKEIAEGAWLQVTRFPPRQSWPNVSRLDSKTPRASEGNSRPDGCTHTDRLRARTVMHPFKIDWLLLALVIDLFSRQVMGWSLREDMTREIAIDALRMAWFKRHPSKQAGLIFHSDRGSQYASNDFRDVLT